MTPDERYLRADLASTQWHLGESNGRWLLKHLEWPHLYVSVFAKDAREFTLKLDCQGYPRSAPTGHLWSLGLDAPLPREQWPQSRPDCAGKPRSVSVVFRHAGWSFAGKALYLPVDRSPLEDHPDWSNLPSAWSPDKGICQYFECVHDVLHGHDYACQIDRA